MRHGHPNCTPDCLTELGHLQTEAAAQRLKDEPISAIYSSKGRAVETAEHIAKVVSLLIKESSNFIREGAKRQPHCHGQSCRCLRQGDLPPFELLNDGRHIEGISTDVFFGN